MKVGILTSSRADFGIYLPLLQKMQVDSFFKLELIAFGTHLSKYHGYTLNEILKAGYSSTHTLDTLVMSDSPEGIATSYALTAMKFAAFWSNNKFDWVFCIGDRFEMAAAVQAGIPSRTRFVHLHGGETTLGAIDNIYRHQITLGSLLHFTSTDQYSLRVREITDNDEIYTVGALSLDGFEEFSMVPREDLNSAFNILPGNFILATFHPESNVPSDNKSFIEEMKSCLREISSNINLVITMPNADTLGTDYRTALLELKEECYERIILVENFGKANYFSAMQYCSLVLGNSSSGIIEAATFQKWVVNVGDRQKGRVASANVVHVPFKADDIVRATVHVLRKGHYAGQNLYYRGNVAQSIIKILKEKHAKL